MLFTAGTATLLGSGGNLTFVSGEGLGSGEIGGRITFQTGDNPTGTGGNVSFITGDGGEEGGSMSFGAGNSEEGNGGTISFAAGNAEGEAGDGGNFWVILGTSAGGAGGLFIVSNLPTANPGFPGAIWNDSGVLKVSG
jgi:hypothetical protein